MKARLACEAGAKSHWPGLEYPSVHQFQRGTYRRAEVHLRQNVLIKIHARRDLDKFRPSRCEAENGTLGYIGHLLTVCRGGCTVKTNLSDGGCELAITAFRGRA